MSKFRIGDRVRAVGTLKKSDQYCGLVGTRFAWRDYKTVLRIYHYSGETVLAGTSRRESLFWHPSDLRKVRGRKK